MTRYAIINLLSANTPTGTPPWSTSYAVANVVEAPDGWADPEGNLTVPSDVAGMGWTYNGATFSPPSLTLSLTQLLTYASSKQNKILAQTWKIDANAGTGNASLYLTTALDPNGSANMTKLVLWGMLNSSNATATEPYCNMDFTTASLTPAQALSLGQQAGAIISASYGVLNGLVEQIQASPATITTTAQIDAASWPVPTT